MTRVGSKKKKKKKKLGFDSFSETCRHIAVLAEI
jgi:hypothetical protein